ncbi:alpha/beta fold hydrolase [Streptosporangium saharense]|uniref:Pimeloyl-ACP methyl ester carboxylesterase n=1 Tax=Streptosporangium saharense TaxID=1706840 RepID=A0A7W7QV04_9ACTN|nr:alpha/beta fold hydrolase [Streptosporangium saharense]MBB4920283.1 pimeloyl-ACP methyl ester carboxylesterase [Streptosporangium saharense]
MLPAGTSLRRVTTNGIETNVAITGTGPAVLLLHGFPHTWRLWSEIIPGLAEHHRVITPDLRGLGASDGSRELGVSGGAVDGYDAGTLAADAEALLDALGEPSATVVGIDLGAPVAFLLAMRRPGRVRRLVLMEALLGRLPGAGDFQPWWFGFHSVPGLAETVLTGHEAEYIDWFLTAGTQGRGVPRPVRDAFVSAYTGSDALRRAFSHYRAAPVSARQIHEAADTHRLTMPTMAIGAYPVGDRLERQLRPITDDLTGHTIDDCGHIIPLDRPDALLPLLLAFTR